MNAVELIDAFGGTKAVAGLCGVRPPSVSGWKEAGRIPDDKLIRLAPIAEARGIITRKKLFPNDWQDIWPELAEAPSAPAQTATETVAIEAVVEGAKAALEDVAETMKVEIKHLAEEVRASLERPGPPWDGITERRHPDEPVDTGGGGQGI